MSVKFMHSLGITADDLWLDCTVDLGRRASRLHDDPGEPPQVEAELQVSKVFPPKSKALVRCIEHGLCEGWFDREVLRHAECEAAGELYDEQADQEAHSAARTDAPAGDSGPQGKSDYGTECAEKPLTGAVPAKAAPVGGIKD